MPKYIDAVRQVADLDDGECALPEDDMTYVCYPVPPAKGTELAVERIERRGETILAISDGGVERCIAGDGAKYCIRGRYVPKRKRR